MSTSRSTGPISGIIESLHLHHIQAAFQRYPTPAGWAAEKEEAYRSAGDQGARGSTAEKDRKADPTTGEKPTSVEADRWAGGSVGFNRRASVSRCSSLYNNRLCKL